LLLVRESGEETVRLDEFLAALAMPASPRKVCARSPDAAVKAQIWRRSSLAALFLLFLKYL
jgi:hypothetical protein